MNIIDNTTFKINKDFFVEEKYIGNRDSKIAIIHDVFEYPEKVLNFIKSFPLELNSTWDADFNYFGPMLTNMTPGFIGEVLSEARPLRRLFNFILNQSFAQIGSVDTMLRINSFIEGTVGPVRSKYPHSENSFSGTLYLCEKNAGGTGFYRFKNGMETLLGEPPNSKKMAEYNETIDSWKYTGKDVWMPIKNDENWEMYHLEKMKWNKIVVYEGDLFHNVFFEKGDYTDQYRTSINLFSK